MFNNYEELLKEARTRQQEEKEDKVKENPLVSQVKEELRRIRKERC